MDQSNELEVLRTCGAKNRRTGAPCRLRAGKGTDHVGVGRCKFHGGASPIKHGKYSRYASLPLGELIGKYRDDPEPLNALEELATARALFAAYLERHGRVLEAGPRERLCTDAKGRQGPSAEEVFRTAAHLLGDVTKAVARIERIRSNNAISAPELYRVMREMGRVVEAHIREPETLEKITGGWLSIRMRVGPAGV